MFAPDYSPETNRALAAEFGAEARIAHDMGAQPPDRADVEWDAISAHVYRIMAFELARKAAHFGRRALEATA